MTDFPYDALEPDWDEYNKVHEWKNYVSDDLKKIWSNLPEYVRKIIAQNFQEIADKEEWD